jgi:hypothetical protein
VRVVLTTSCFIFGMGEPERLNGLPRENVVPVIGLRCPDMLQCALRGMGVVDSPKSGSNTPRADVCNLSCRRATRPRRPLVGRSPESAEDAVKAAIFFSMWALGGHDSALKAAQLTGGREAAPVPAEGLPAGCRS